MSDPSYPPEARVTPALWWRVLRHVLHLMDEKNLGLISAGVAFYSILAVFPGLAATIALWGVIGDPALALAQLEEFRALLPNDVYALIA
ncbi:MAG: YhjD/YihY/BrkB family envelope integrity protein, partial [Pseudomonadota bacterium]